ncbi:hypothetical protein A3F66_01060 [candidate division TM6 bacterium RIFCSPHIGHO2_12_FULL_32_22]|nr:MAG: hypothetical protein A3F66_01060 [candidate division TM6 bacterium RIFCSPHIGHO2_12_FULL_32_22]
MKKIFLILLIAITSLFIDQTYPSYHDEYPYYSEQQGLQQGPQQSLDQCKAELKATNEYLQSMTRRYDRWIGRSIPRR